MRRQDPGQPATVVPTLVSENPPENANAARSDVIGVARTRGPPHPSAHGSTSSSAVGRARARRGPRSGTTPRVPVPAQDTTDRRARLPCDCSTRLAGSVPGASA